MSFVFALLYIFNKMKKKPPKNHTVGTILKSNIKIVEIGNMISVTHKYRDVKCYETVT